MTAPGLQDGQVLQQVAGVGEAQVTNAATVTAEDTGDVVVRVDAAGPLRIPVGGPYVVESRDGVLARDVHVGDLFVLGGQSNMQGGAPLRDLEPVGPAVRLFGLERTWQQPIEPLHRLWRSPEPVHTREFPMPLPEDIDDVIAKSVDGPEPHIGAGCGIAFANAYVAAAGVPVGLLPAAYGGSSLDDWNPDRDNGLYAAMVRIVAAAGGRVAGLLWHQGESEADTDLRAASYVANARRVFDAFRRDLLQPDLPVYAAQIGFFPIDRRPGTAQRWTDVRAAQLDPEPLGIQGVVATADLTTSDPIHLDSASLRRLGRRYARLVTGQAATISIGEVTRSGRLAEWPEVVDCRCIRIRLQGVTGELSAAGRPDGFSVRTADGSIVPSVWRVDLDGDTIAVWLAGPPVDGAALYYGWGAGSDTHCNIIDALDMAVPAFGPVAL